MHTFTTIFASLNGFRVLVKANRFGCDTDFARDVHDKLIGKLDEAIAAAASVLSAQRYALSDASDFGRNPGEYVNSVQEVFIDDFIECGEIPLVDYLDADEFMNEWRCEETGRRVFLGQPKVADVADEELFGLRPILKAIRQETRIKFSAYRLQN